MSSPQDLYHYSAQSAVYNESGSSPTLTQHSHSPGPSWMPNATADSHFESGYSQSHQSGGLFHVESMNYAPSHTQTAYPPQDTSFQEPASRSGPMYNDNFDFTSFQHLYNYSNFDHRHSYPPYGSSHGFLEQSSATNGFQMSDLTHTLDAYHPQGIYAPQFPQDAPTLVYRSSSLTRLPSMDHNRLLPAYGNASDSARPATEISKSDGVNTASAELPSAGAGPHSHAPVATSLSNQISAAGPSRLIPGSPERKRLLPLSADEGLSTTRNVVPRSDRAWSVHSTSPDSLRRGRSSDIPGRGPLIPQDRYTTGSVSPFNVTRITFDLENPDQIGIPIIDILNKTGSYNRIRGRTQAFDHMGKKTFTLRVQWPGYKSWCKTIAALNWKKSRDPITRVKLAEDIATAIRDLVQKKRDERYDSDYAEWNVGPNGIQLDQLCLVALHHVSKGSWQPQLCLLQPRQG